MWKNMLYIAAQPQKQGYVFMEYDSLEIIQHERVLISSQWDGNLTLLVSNRHWYYCS